MRRGVIILAGLSSATSSASAALADLGDVPVRVHNDFEALSALLVGGAVGPLRAIVVDFCRNPEAAGAVIRSARRSQFYGLTPVVALARRQDDLPRAYDAGAQSVVLLRSRADDGARLARAVRYWMSVNHPALGEAG